MLYNVRIKIYPDGHKQYFWSENLISRLDFENDSPELIEDVTRRYEAISRKRKISKFNIYEGDLPEDDVPFRFRGNLFRAINAVYDLARSNEFNWFVTLTLNEKYVDRYDYSKCADVVKLFTDRLRKLGCRWVIVPEQHEDGAYHFHGLVQGNLPLTPSGKMWYNEVEGYAQPVYNVANYEFGWTTATEIVHTDRCATYVTKYLVKKPAVPKGKKCYWASKSLARPTVEYYDATGDSNFVFGVPSGVRYVKEIENEYGRYVLSEE